MLDLEALDEAREILSEGDFYHPAHRMIFSAIGTLRDQGHTPAPGGPEDQRRIRRPDPSEVTERLLKPFADYLEGERELKDFEAEMERKGVNCPRVVRPTIQYRTGTMGVVVEPFKFIDELVERFGFKDPR